MRVVTLASISLAVLSVTVTSLVGASVSTTLKYQSILIHCWPAKRRPARPRGELRLRKFSVAVELNAQEAVGDFNDILCFGMVGQIGRGQANSQAAKTTAKDLIEFNATQHSVSSLFCVEGTRTSDTCTLDGLKPYLGQFSCP